MARRVRETACVAVFVVVFALLLHLTHIGCPIKFVTGVSCPGCGMTRAWLAALSGDWSAAFCYHPLFWAFPLALVLLVVSDRLPRRLVSAGAASLAVALLLVWAMRLAGSLTPAGGDAERVVSIDAPVWVMRPDTLANDAWQDC